MKLQIHKVIMKDILYWKKSHRDDSHYKLDKVTYCCKDMKSYWRRMETSMINSKGIFEWSSAKINYCSFCGTKIVIKKGKTVTLVNKPRKIEIERDNWVEE